MVSLVIPWRVVFIILSQVWPLVYFIMIAMLTVISGWILGVHMRRRIKKDLGAVAYEGDLTSIETWIKVDEVEEKSGASPNRDWVPKSSNIGFHAPQSLAVVRSFDATEPISGRKCRVSSGQTIQADLDLPGSNVTIEMGMTYLEADFLTLSKCCKKITETGLREVWP
jgi:hypothetical protein